MAPGGEKRGKSLVPKGQASPSSQETSDTAVQKIFPMCCLSGSRGQDTRLLRYKYGMFILYGVGLEKEKGRKKKWLLNRVQTS